MSVRLVLPILMVSVAFAASPVRADQWYEHYARAEDALAKGDADVAIAELNLAIERRGDSGLRVRTYGMRVTDYFPYLKLGLAYLLADQYEAALRAFDTEERIGAVAGSERATRELEEARRRATEALERQRLEQQQTIDEVVERSLGEARDLQGQGRLDEALAAVARALALAPDGREANELEASLREALALRDERTRAARREQELIEEGKRLRARGEPGAAAARFRQAVELVPGGEAAGLLEEVQRELVAQAESQPTTAAAEALVRARGMLDSGELRGALEAVQTVIASDPGRAGAAELEREILARLEADRRAAEIEGRLVEGTARLDAGDPEGAIAAANLVLASDPRNARALRLIQQAYAKLSRRLLGTGPVENLPPAIRFVEAGPAGADGSPVHLVDRRDLRLGGVVIDETEVDLRVTDVEGEPVRSEQSSQPVGGVTITEFHIEARLPVGPTSLEVTATDPEGLSSRSEYVVEYRPPAVASPRVWAAAAAALALVAGLVAGRRILRRRRLRRRRFNPFVAGPPIVEPGLFVGREALLERVLATVPNNSLLLLGERRIGKTSVLHQLRRRLPGLDHPGFDFIPVPVDLQGVAEDEFFATLAEAVGGTIGDGVMAAARAEHGYDSRELVRDLRRVLPSIGCRAGKRAKLVLLLDEIDELNGYSHRTNQRLRSLFMRGFADQLVAVAAGVGIARDWEHEGSPWYNFFEELEVGPLDEAAARRLLTEPLAGVVAIDDAAVGFMVTAAQGRPYELQRWALEAVQRAYEAGRGRITLADVESVVRR